MFTTLYFTAILCKDWSLTYLSERQTLILILALQKIHASYDQSRTASGGLQHSHKTNQLGLRGCCRL